MSPVGIGFAFEAALLLLHEVRFLGVRVILVGSGLDDFGS